MEARARALLLLCCGCGAETRSLNRQGLDCVARRPSPVFQVQSVCIYPDVLFVNSLSPSIGNL